MARTCKDAIREALVHLGGEGTTEEVKNYIKPKYGDRWEDNTITTLMADLAYPGNPSSNIPMNERFLIRIGRGKYRLRGKKEMEPTSLSLKEAGYSRIKTELTTSRKTQIVTFDFKKAEDVLKSKGQLVELKQSASITNLSAEKDHNDVQRFLESRSWETEVKKFPVSGYSLDAFKNKTAVEIERSLIDAVHRSLFRCIWAYHKNLIDVLVFIVPTYKEPRFRNVVRDLKAFKEIIPCPLYVIGVNR